MKKDKRKIDQVTEYEYLFSEKEVKGKKKSRFLPKFFKKNWRGFTLSGILDIFKSLPIWVIPLVTAEVINVVAKYIGGDVSSNYAIKFILISCAVFVGMLLLNIPLHYVWAKINSKIFRDNSANTRIAVVRKLQKLSITYHKDMETGKVQSKFLRDVDNVDILVGYLQNILIPSIIAGVISVGIAIYRSGIVSLFFLLAVPANVSLALLFRKKMMKNAWTLRNNNEIVSNKLSNIMEMLVVTKAHGLDDKEYYDFTKKINKLKKSGRAIDITNSYFASFSWGLSNLLSGVCILFCAYLALKGKIAIGDIVLYQSLFSSINNNVMNIINSMPSITQGLDSAKSISEIMNYGELEHNGKGELANMEGAITFENVCYNYPESSQMVIKDLNLAVKPGECIAVVGSSGSGKTTLINMVIGFLQPTSGKIYVDDKNMYDLNLYEYRQKISVVPQNSILFAGSIRDNITYGMDKYTEEELSRVVESANINEFIAELPDGIDTQIGEHGGRLSGGQKQRISIARALIRNPKVLILDEATSALDNISEYHVQKAIAELIKNRTTFIVAHRLSTIRDADRIVVMENGVAVEIGCYDELMEKKGKFYELKCLNDLNYKEAEEGLNIDNEDAPHQFIADGDIEKDNIE